MGRVHSTFRITRMLCTPPSASMKSSPRHVDVAAVDVDRYSPVIALGIRNAVHATLMPSWKKATALWAITCLEP